MSKGLGKMTSHVLSNLSDAVMVISNHSYSLFSAISIPPLPSCLSLSSLFKASPVLCLPGGDMAVRKGAGAGVPWQGWQEDNGMCNSLKNPAEIQGCERQNLHTPAMRKTRRASVQQQGYQSQRQLFTTAETADECEPFKAPGWQ